MQQRGEVGLGPVVESTGWLIKQQPAGPGDGDRAKGNPLALADAQVSRVASGHRRQPQSPEQIVYLAYLGLTVVTQGDAQFLGDALGEEQAVGFLGQTGDLLADCRHAAPRGRAPCNPHVAPALAQQPDDAAEQGAFANAVAAHQHGDLARPDGEAHSG